ncbi:MAG: DNA topoisomerase VI subunit B [Phycisphaerales bacterium]|nr:DNA topoisomerase VI subunit B [Planctomycetota bacterium]
MSDSALLEDPSTGATKPKTMKSKQAPRATAESMAAKQRDISVSEFFAKNRHLLGFDNPRKALLTTVKEAVDNSLDACEEAGILPDITVIIEDLQPDRPASAKSGRYRVTVVDNGPGIVRKQVENIFGRLLYGSKFHRLKMSRGQQGIGISAAGMYGLITTGKPMVIHTKPSAKSPAHHIELAMNTKTNRAEVTEDSETKDFPPARFGQLTSGTRELVDKGEFLSPATYTTGTSVSIELDGRYQKGRGSVDEFLELTAIANPHARFTFVPPSKASDEEEDVPLLRRGKKAEEKNAPADAVGSEKDSPGEGQPPKPIEPQVTTETGGVMVFPRAVEELPAETKEIQPHPRGIELGILLQMLKEAEIEKPGYTLYNFLQDKFSRVSAGSASAFCEKIGVTSRTKVADVDHDTAEKLFREFQDSKLPPPPTDCLAPIGVQQLLKGMFKGVRAEFYAASSREAAVYRGRPFLIEAAIAFGGELSADEPCRVIRFANRVPLLFQQSACSSFKAVIETNWRNYDLQQPRGAVPVGALVIMIHMASVWVPFTSESKEAIADYDEIRKEMKLALMECGRKLGSYLNKRLKMRRESERRDIFERYIGEIANACNAINGVDAKKLYEAMLVQARKRTAIADLQLDDEGKKVKEPDPADQEGVIIVEQAANLAPAEPAPVASPAKATKAEKAASDLGKRAKKKGEAEQPTLIAAAAKPSRKVEAKPSKKSAKTEPPPARLPSQPPSRPPSQAPSRPTPPAAAPGKKPKPKMRLENGKLVPVDEPGLF